MGGSALGVPNRFAEAATINGGSWLVAAPASNVATWPLAETAVSTNALTTSTIIKVRWDTGPRTGQLLVLARHNLSAAALVRWTRGTSDGAADVADSGWVSAWRLTPRAADGALYNVFVLQSQESTANYETIEIDDTTNAAGAISIGRGAVCPLFAPRHAIDHTVRDGWSDLSTVAEAESGADWPTARRRRRGVQFALPLLTLDEGDAAHEIDQVEGTTAEVVWLPYMEDPARMQRYGFIGRMRELSSLEYPGFRRRAKGYSLVQRV